MEKKRRISLIDEVRGLCILLVIIYHLYYSLAMIFHIEEVYGIFGVMRVYQPILPGMFILISGISFQLSRSNVKRGIILFAVAMAMTAILALAMPEQIIWFGIIHFLGLANIVCGLLKNKINKIPAALGIVCCVILFLLTYNVQRGYIGFEGLFAFELPRQMYSTDLTMMFGFFSPSFRSSDYCPILPWIFLFLPGTILGRYVQKLPDSLCKTHIRPLAFIGRHTLIIYLIHQPIIVGIGYLVL